MMLTCPKCHAKSTVPSEIVPASGAWARCPRCSERFFIRHLGQGAGLNEQPRPSPAKSARVRSEEAQRMIDRLRSKTEAEGQVSLDGPAYSPDIITVFPQPASGGLAVFLAIGVMVVLVGVVLVGAFTKGSTVTIAAPEPTGIININVYGEKELRADFLLFRKLTTGRPYLRKRVDYTGFESRVFKFFLKEMAPAECQDIASLFIKAERAANGFTATAACLDPGRTIPDLSVRWEGRDAVIMFAGQNERRRFTLFPLEGQPTADGLAAHRDEPAPGDEAGAN